MMIMIIMMKMIKGHFRVKEGSEEGGGRGHWE
jgi:hypothetical protein